jgi:multidrug efflux pump subunit AcrB
MFSAIFIDRPRLATVIAIVTTIAGLLSLFVIPIAQYPDIVPPQVSVTTLYPGQYRHRRRAAIRYSDPPGDDDR